MNYIDLNNKKEFYLKFFINIFLYGAIVVQTLGIGIWFWNWKFLNKNIALSFVPLFFIIILLIAKLFFKKFGYIFAGVGFIFALLVMNFKEAIIWGIDLPQSIVMFALTIIISGAILGPVWTFICGITVSIGQILIYVLNQNGIIQYQSNWRNEPLGLIDFIALIIFLLLMSAVSWLYNREIINGLKRAIKSEEEAVKLADELQIEKDSLEIKVEERTKELREKQLEELTQITNMAEFGKMAAGLLHDIKNPLTVISLNLDSLKSSKNKEILDLVNKSLLAAKTAETIIKASQRQMKEKEDKQEFNLINEIENTLLLVEHRALNERVKIVFVKEKNKILIKSYPGKITRIVANLLMNAIDSFDGLNIQNKEIRVEVKENNKKIFIVISDNGCGIDEVNKNNIFKAGESFKKIEGRVGLGLYGSKKIAVEELKGDITFVSKKNTGSEFTLSINYEI